MKHKSRNRGVCSTRLEFELENGIVRDIKFEGGCSGNLQGVGRLAEGRNALEVIGILKGIRCGRKATSCPDQLACAIEAAIKQEEEKTIE